MKPSRGQPRRQRAANDLCKRLKTAPALFGLTITDLDQAEAAIVNLRQMSAVNQGVPLVVRIVFDPIQESSKSKFESRLSEYQTKVKNLREASGVCVMGTIADSYQMHFYLPESAKPNWPVGYRNYKGWTERLVDTMGDLVDIWEVGNEVNGEWYGWKDGDYKTKGEDKKVSPEYQRRRELKRLRVRQELKSAYSEVRRLRPAGLTALTLLYNADQNSRHCTEFPEYKMNDWAAAYLDPEIRSGVDFVFLSYYENTQDCSQVSKSAEPLSRVFASLRDELFTGEQTAFGFGEISYKQTCYRADKPDEEIPDARRVNNPLCQSGQKQYLEDYYRTLDKELLAAIENRRASGAKEIRFVGGYFYWYYLQDVVLSTNAEAAKVKTILSDSRRIFRNPPGR